LTLYGYKKKTTTFSGQGPTIGTPYQPVSYGGGLGGTSSGGGRELPSGLFGQGSRQRERGVPERIPPSSTDTMGFIGQAVAAPAHTLERPAAILNIITGGGEGKKGAVDHFLDAASQIGFGSEEGKPGVVSLGSLAGFAGTVLQRSNDLIPALTNSTDARLAALTARLPDSFVMTPEYLVKNGFMPQSAGGAIFGIGSHPKTVGELRTELSKRGFNKDDEGRDISWDQVAAKVADGPFGQFMFGNKAVNDNEMVNMASRLVFDPLNLAFGTGLITKAGRGVVGAAEAAGRFAPWAADGAYKLSYAGSQAIRPIRWGSGYLRDMAATGVRAESMAPVRQAAEAFAQGQVTGLSLKALGWAGRTYFLPGSGSLLRRYARGALRTEATLLGAEAITYPLTQSLQEIPIASGILEGVHDMSKSFLEDKPLSENSLFVMTSAFSFPVGAFAGEAKTGAALRFKAFAGSNDLSMWAQKWGTSKTRTLRDPYGRIRGGEKEASVLDAFGGEEGFKRAIYHVDLRIAYERLIEHNPYAKQHFKSFDEAMARGSALSDRVVELAEHMRSTGKIKARDRMDTFEEWAKGRERTIADEQGMPRPGVAETVRFDNLTFKDMADQWNTYDAVQAALQERFVPVGEAIVGRMGRLTQEDVHDLIASVRAASVNGKTPTSLVTSVMLKHPAMFEDFSALTPEDVTFFKSLMTLGRAAQGDAPIGGQLSRLATAKSPTYDTGQLVARLEGVASISPPAKELFGEAAMAESRVTVPSPESGPLTAAGHRPIYSPARIREYRENAHAQVAAKQREYVAAEEQFNRDWTKTHGPRKGSPLDLNLQSRNVIVEPARYDAVRRAGENFLDEGTHNLAPPVHFTENREAVVADLYSRVQEPWGRATYNPRTGEFVVPVKGVEGPYASAVGQEVSLSVVEARDPALFREAIDRLVETNKDLLGHDDFYIGVFHDDALAKVDLDVSMLTATRDDTIALQTALGNQTGGAYDFTTGDGVYGVNPDWAKYISEKSREAYPAISPEQADSLAQVADVAARAWAKQTGRPANEFYAKFIGGIERGLVPTETALFQTMDALTLGRLGRHGISLDDLTPSGITTRQMIEEPAPAVLTEAGMGEYANIEWTKFPGTPVEVGIPGGMAGLDDAVSTFSFWDMWRLKAQAINPRQLPPAVAQKLYTKLFRSQVRSLEDDSLDALNRMVFALQSPNQNLLANEAIYSAIRLRSEKDVRDFAGIYDEVIGSGFAPDDPRLVQRLGLEVQRRHGLEQGTEPKGQGVNTITSQIQMGNTVLLAKRYLEQPEFFMKKAEESLLEYVERLAAITPGAGFKVSNFGVMVGDPIASTQGTLDSHMAQLLGVGLKAPKAQPIKYRLANGEINPKVPMHLRDLPWEPTTDSVTIFGGKYAAAHKVMEEMASKEGIEAFGHGGYQWFRWDQKRGGLEPHTLIYPGAYKLPKMATAERQAAFATQQASGFRAMSALNFRGFRPSEGFLYQKGPLPEAELMARLNKTIFQSGPKRGQIKPGMEAESQRLNLAIETARRGGVRGETEFVNDVRGIMRGFESADFSTAVHEWTHVYRRVLTDSPEDLAVLESHFGVKDSAWAREHEEAFSAELETYLSSGKAANPEIASVFEKFKVWLGNLYEGVRGKAVKITPEVKQVFDNLFSATKREEMWAPLRQSHQDNLAALREGVKAARREVRAIDRDLDAIRTVKIDPRFLDPDGNPKVDPASIEELQAQTAFLAREYPAYDIEPAPRLAIAFRPDDSHLAALLTERSNLAHMVLNYGPLSKGLRIIEAMTAPVNSQKMARDARQMVFNKLIPLGAAPKEVRVFFQTLSETGKDLTTTALHQPLFRGITALPPNAVSAALRKAVEKNEAFVANFEKRYGGMDRAHVMLDESYNSAVRAVDTKRLMGQKVGPIASAFRAGYYAWQTVPVLRAMSDQTRFLSKVAYPFFRFQMDLRWQTLNMVEADIMAFFRDGFQATRFARRNDLLVPRGPRGKMVDISDNAAALHMSRRGVPIPGLNARTSADIGSSPNLPRALADETGIQITNRHLYQVLKREFNVERPETITKVIDALPDTDPTIGLLIKKFGTDRSSWAEQVAETVYSFDSKGVRRTVQQAAKQVQKYEKWTPEESAMMVPLVDKIIERNQRLMDDLLQVHIGNVNRSRLERVANSYWLYWPISYQIKAAKWMVRILSDRALGQKTNLGGAWTLDRMAEVFKEQANVSEDFQQQLEDSSPVWFMASMLLPIAPWDPGVSLNRYVRYAGGNGLGLWKAYAGLDTAQDWAMKFFEMGPIYTIKLAQQITDSLTQTEPTYQP
jgi:hypothetical protein